MHINYCIRRKGAGPLRSACGGKKKSERPIRGKDSFGWPIRARCREIQQRNTGGWDAERRLRCVCAERVKMCVSEHPPVPTLNTVRPLLSGVCEYVWENVGDLKRRNILKKRKKKHYNKLFFLYFFLVLNKEHKEDKVLSILRHLVKFSVRTASWCRVRLSPGWAPSNPDHYCVLYSMFCSILFFLSRRCFELFRFYCGSLEKSLLVVVFSSFCF